MTSSPSVVLILLAAGHGTRMGGDIPKQYQTLNGKPMISHAIETALTCPEITGILPVIAANAVSLYDSLLNSSSFCKDSRIYRPVIGGPTRSDSLHQGMQALQRIPTDYVLVHDAARPYISARLIRNILAATLEHGAAFPVVAVTDTIYRRDHQGEIVEALPRERLVAAQTPQGARYDTLLKALHDAQELYTDEASLLMSQGVFVKAIAGDITNIKMTWLSDMA